MIKLILTILLFTAPVLGDHIIFINLNNTLYTAPNTLCQKKWRDHLEKEIHRTISNHELATSLFNKLTLEFVEKQTKTLVNKEMPRIIRELQNDGNIVLGFSNKPKTLYGIDFWALTNDHIKALDINFTPLESSNEEGIYELAYGILFEDPRLKKTQDESGIINFILNNDLPNKIKVLDNHLENLKRIEKAAKNSRIEFEGVLVTPPIITFDPHLGTIQWEAFLRDGTYLDDTEARQIKKAAIEQEKLSTQELIDAYFNQKLIDLINSF